jgi:hypothetical protein
MSGGGGSGDVAPVGPRPGLDCSALAFEAALASPDMAVVSTLNVGDVLILDLRQGAGGRNMIAALTTGGQVAGAITERTADLLRCLQQGVGFEAEITQMNGGWIKVAVRAA